MRVIVTGAREWTNEEAIRFELRKLPTGSTVIHGDCRGADKIAGKVAKELGFEVIAVPANWNRDGKAAGPIRNIRMLEEYWPIDAVLAFHEDISASKGTRHMVAISRARALNAPELVVEVFTGRETRRFLDVFDIPS